MFVLDFAKDFPVSEPLVVHPSSISVRTQKEYLSHNSLGAMFDWKVCCSPVGEMQERRETKTSLIPLSRTTCIN